MKTIEPLTLRADVVGGATPSTGNINPAGLRAVVNRSFGNAAYAEPGQVPLNDLANIGQRFLKETPSSQTSERSNIFRWLEITWLILTETTALRMVGFNLPNRQIIALS